MLSGVGALEDPAFFAPGNWIHAGIEGPWLARIDDNVVDREPAPVQARLKPSPRARSVGRVEYLTVSCAEIEHIRVHRGSHKHSHVTAPWSGDFPLANLVSSGFDGYYSTRIVTANHGSRRAHQQQREEREQTIEFHVLKVL